jgi:hypothetical protein
MAEDEVGGGICWRRVAWLYIGNPSGSSPAHLQPNSASSDEATMQLVVHPANRTTNCANQPISRSTERLITLIKLPPPIKLKEPTRTINRDITMSLHGYRFRNLSLQNILLRFASRMWLFFFMMRFQ